MRDETLVLLSLGGSTNEGVGLDDVRLAWPYLLTEMLETDLGKPIRIEVRRFNPDGRDPSEYVERLIAEIRPHALMVGVGAYYFGVGRVVNRINQLFGIRVARIASKLENKTRTLQKSASPGLVNRWSRRVVTRFIGTAPMVTRSDVEHSLETLFRTLSRHEDIAVVVRETSGAGSAAIRERNPGYAALADDFAREWELRARKLHFYWDPTTRDLPDGSYLKDGVHRSELGHRLRAEGMRAIVAQALRETALSR